MPSLNHSIIQAMLIALLVQKYKNLYTIASELSLELESGLATPDISIYPKLTPNWQHDEIKVNTPPLLVIEILSPTQGMIQLMDKMTIYFAGGVKSYWIVNPMIETIAVFNAPQGKPQVYNTGEVKDNATGITITVEDLFG